MDASCERALKLGLTAIAFTDHADFTDYVRARGGVLDIRGYHECLERCRTRHRGLRILSGVELGEPHRFPAEAAAILGAGPLDRVLGSVHCAPVDGRLQDAGNPDFRLRAEAAPKFMRDYLAETLALVQSSQPFQVLAHLDYPKRYWPHAALEFRETDYEEELRAVLVAAAKRGAVLEVNTTRGADPRRGLCPGAVVVGWWRDAGGAAISFGSDAHDPLKVAAGFQHAAQVVEACGFRPARDVADYWRR
jgi:histidinol-phosphatase (PHP family)